MDYYDLGPVHMSGVTAEGMPSVGSVVGTMASLAGSVIIVGGMVASMVFGLRHYFSSPGHHGRGNGGRDSDPSHVVVSDVQPDRSTALPHPVMPIDASGAVMPATDLTPGFHFAMRDSSPLMLIDHLNILIPAFRDSLGDLFTGEIAVRSPLPELTAAEIVSLTTTGLPAIEWNVTGA